MPTVPVLKVPDPTPEGWRLLPEIETTLQAIQRRAYELFEQRGGALDADLEDWLRAERELLWIPQSELTENDREFHLRVAVPGMDATDIQVTAFLQAIAIHAGAAHRHESEDQEVRLCEFSRNQVFRRFDLPSGIDPARVSATLDKGILEVVAEKVAVSLDRKRGAVSAVARAATGTDG